MFRPGPAASRSMAASVSSAFSRAMRSVMLSSIWPLKLASFFLMPPCLSADEAHRVCKLAAQAILPRAMCAGARRVALSKGVLLSCDMVTSLDRKKLDGMNKHRLCDGKYRASIVISRSWRCPWGQVLSVSCPLLGNCHSGRMTI